MNVYCVSLCCSYEDDKQERIAKLGIQNLIPNQTTDF